MLHLLASIWGEHPTCHLHSLCSSVLGFQGPLPPQFCPKGQVPLLGGKGSRIQQLWSRKILSLPASPLEEWAAWEGVEPPVLEEPGEAEICRGDFVAALGA